MAHRLMTQAGAGRGASSAKCATPHGHNELVSVELVPRHPMTLDGQSNMVAEFGALKTAWHAFVDQRLDHALQLSEHDPLLAIVDEQFSDWRVVVTPGDPSTELMAALLASKCQAILNVQSAHDPSLDLRVARVRLTETPTNTVVFEGDPSEVLPRREGWWSRADDTTR